MGRYDEANPIPNQINAPAPHSEFIVPANYPNQWSLVRKPPKAGGKKPGKKGRGNLMDTGPDDYDVAPSAFEQAAEQSTQALSSGQQTLGASPVEQYLQSQATGRQDIGSYQVGTGGQMTPPPGTYGFRERESTGDLGITAPPPTEAPPVPQQQRRPRPASNLMDSGPDDDSHVSRPETRRDAYGRVYRVGSASDPYASQRGGGLPFDLPSTEDLPFPGVTGAILGGVSGISNRNLDRIEDRAQLDPSDPEYDDRYTYGEVGNQRFGTSAGFIPGTTVVSGPSELRGLGVNTTVPNTAENQQKLLEAQQQDEYKSASGNTYVGATATAKREADEEAQSRGYGSAVTDSSGKAVRDSSGNVVTSGGRIQQEEESVSHGGSDDNDSGGGGK